MKRLFFLILFPALFAAEPQAQKQVRKQTNIRKPGASAEQTASSKPKTQTDSRDTADKKISPMPDAPLKIIYKPRAAYPQPDGGSVCIQGAVVLKAQFLESGKIGEIKIISSLPYGANENAVEAAKKIKFKPAIKDGKPVTVVKTVQFSFTIY